jgi:hypothetical protein
MAISFELMPLTLERVLVVKLGRPFFQPFAVKDNWNILPSVSFKCVKVHRDNFDLLVGKQN